MEELARTVAAALKILNPARAASPEEAGRDKGSKPSRLQGLSNPIGAVRDQGTPPGHSSEEQPSKLA